MSGLDRLLPRPGAAIAWRDTQGSGPAIVLLHGAGLDHTTLAPQAEALARTGRRVISFDLRGHGLSALAPGARFAAADALDDLLALLDAAEVERAILLGHSLGGNLAQTFVGLHPDRATGLVVLNATWNTGPLASRERIAMGLGTSMVALIPRRLLPTVLARASAVTPSAIARGEAIFARMPKSAFVDVWRAAVSLVEPDPGYRTPVRLALVRGAQDRTGNIATAIPRWAHAEGVTERIIPDAGHLVSWDAPEATSALLVKILDGWDQD